LCYTWLGLKIKVLGGFKMWMIVFKVNKITGTEGKYKNILIARRHLRRLQKRYLGTQFNIRRLKK